MALDGVHVAQALGVPCIAISPGRIPYSPPQKFAEQLESTLPGGLQEALQQCPEGEETPAVTSGLQCCS